MIDENTKARIERLIKEQRYSLPEIANLCNVSITYVTKMKHDIFGATKRERHIYPKELTDEIAYEYFIGGKTQKELSAKYGLSKNEIYCIRRNYERQYPKKKFKCGDRAEQIKKLFEQNLTQSQIARQVGVSKAYVSVIKQRYGLQRAKGNKEKEQLIFLKNTIAQCLPEVEMARCEELAYRIIDFGFTRKG